jgi:hypothetical protein
MCRCSRDVSGNVGFEVVRWVVAVSFMVERKARISVWRETHAVKALGLRRGVVWS